MKNLGKSFAAACFVFGFSSLSFAGGAILVQAPIDKVFVPQGFDDNDKVEVIVHGHFTSTCYKMGPVTATIDKDTKKLQVNAEAYYYPQATCLQMIVPFIKSVEVNRHLDAGNYNIEVLGRPEARSMALGIAHTTRPEADDFLYASVYSASLEQNDQGTQEVVLKGQHPYMFDGCVKFESIKTYLGLDNVLVVQPITKIVTGDECVGSNALSRFEEHVTLGTSLSKGEYVMHVRVLDGNAINQFVEIE
jgi:hypothetical protein